MATKILCDRCGLDVGNTRKKVLLSGIDPFGADLCEGCVTSLKMWFERMLSEGV